MSLVAMRRAALRRLSMAVALLTVPWIAYPGNWVTVAPASAVSEQWWTGDAVLVYVSLILGLSWLTIAGRGVVRDLVVGAPDTKLRWLGALGQAITEPRGRLTFVVSGLGYGVLFGLLTGLLTISSPVTSAEGAASSGSFILCCGPPGTTPGAVFLVASRIQIAVNPAGLLLLVAGVVLFAANVTAAVRLMRRHLATRSGIITGTTGVLGTFLLGCPSCGTILLASLLAGAGAAGILIDWTTYQTPLLLVAFPLAIGSLYLAGRQLVSVSSCGLPPSTTA